MLSHPAVSRTTVAKYNAMASVQSKDQTANSVQQKIDNHHNTEKSLIPTVSFLFTVAITHLFVGEIAHSHTYRNKMTIGAHKLVRLVRSCNNNAPIYAVLPGLIV